jgi:hypothetical protein
MSFTSCEWQYKNIIGDRRKKYNIPMIFCSFSGKDKFINKKELHIENMYKTGRKGCFNALYPQRDVDKAEWENADYKQIFCTMASWRETFVHMCV